MAEESDKLFHFLHKCGLTPLLAKYSKTARDAMLAGVHYNPILLTHEMTAYDLLTDSLIFNIIETPNTLSNGQFETNFFNLENTLRGIFPFKHIFPVSQGRGSEWFLSQLIKPSGKIVTSNSLFPTTRIHMELQGAQVLECSVEEAFQVKSAFPFKGNLDLEKVKNIFAEKGASQCASLYVELANNAVGGQPVSLQHLEELSVFCKQQNLPLILDGCRIVDNALMIKEREDKYKNHKLSEIIRLTCEKADAITMSLSKNFYTEQGALIAFNIDSWKEEMQDLLMVMGDGLSLRQKANINCILTNSLCAEFRDVVSRSRLTYQLWSMLDRENVPPLHPRSSFAAYIDGSDVMETIGAENFPLKSFIVELFQRSGILIGESSPSPQQEARKIATLRAITPLRYLSKGAVSTIATQIGKLWKDLKSIPGLEAKELSKAKSAVFTAKFSRKPKN